MEVTSDEQVRRFEALVHASPDFTSIATPDGRVQFLNAAGRELVGLGPDVDVTALRVEDMLTDAAMAQLVLVQRPAIHARGRWDGTSTLRDWRGGPPIPVEVTSTLLRDGDTGAPIAIATVQRDLREVLQSQDRTVAALDALEVSEARSRALLTHMSDALLVTDEAGVLRYASPSAQRVFGAVPGTREGDDVALLVHPDDRESARRALRAVARHGGTGPVLRLRLAEEGRWVEAVTEDRLADPGVRGLVVTARDVTQRHCEEQAQAGQARVLELIASGAPVGDVLVALARWVEDQRPATRCSVLLRQGDLLVLGAAPTMSAEYREAVDGLPLGTPGSPCGTAVRGGEPELVPDLLADEAYAPFHALARRCGVRSCWSYPVLSPATGGTIGTFALYGAEPGLPDAEVEALLARASHLVGITLDRQALLDRLAHDAHHDALTGLPNRVRLLEVLSRALAAGTSPTVVFLDLDRLKIVNDSLGHETGDELLVRVADRLRAAVPPGDLVARFGGDEFVVVSGVRGRADAEQLTDRLLSAVAEPVLLDGRQVTPSASAGVVLADPRESATDALRDADIAMYRAKHRGGSGHVLFDEGMRTRAFDRLELEGQLRDGLAAGQFVVHYQPVVDLQAGGAVVGFEALLRWQHPERGLLTPAAFVDLAEETGLIVPLGEWVLRTAAAEVRGWADHVDVRGLTLSVNLAAQQLATPGLLHAVSDCVRALGPWSLGLELTESTLMADTGPVRAVLDQLAASGAALSIDDFGTGYSSLSYLTRLPVATLKIDRSFVTDLGQSADAATVASAVVGLGDGLRLRVIAEGVETEEQRRTLREMGCRYAQGYLFGAALPAAEALALLEPVRRLR